VVTLIPLTGLPEVRPGDDVAALLGDAVERAGGPEDGDVLVVAQKAVSKAEGRVEQTDDLLAAILGEARAVRRRRGDLVIAETKHGFVCANAGVDASNVSADTVCLLPEDPDRSAAGIRDGLKREFGVEVGVIVSDSFGRPWRNGIINVAIGVAGIPALADYRGLTDEAGYSLHVTVLAVADEIAAAAELVMNKLDKRPVAIVRGYQFPVSAEPGTGRDLLMDPARDLFR
jgi:coenzyme F420-0:L-glutamate ligase/coenzyme F420-1:gamma-L-glutamate ligase